MSRLLLRLLATLALVTALLPGIDCAVAQESLPHESGPVDQFDPAVAPLVLPGMDAFAPPPATEGVAAEPISPLSVSGYFDVTEQLRLFQVGPAYAFTPAFRAKVRVPWIIERRLAYYAHEATASGLGDVAVDLEYARTFASSGQRVGLLASVKLPTGDEEHLDSEDYAVPLGSGSVDVLLRGSYARSTARSGLLGSLLYRVNAAGEMVNQWIDPGDPGHVQTTTTRTTAGNQFVAAAFGRRELARRWWMHLGISLMVTGDGKQEVETTDNAGLPPSSWDTDLAQRGTLVDLFPGVSYRVGSLTPYLGARVPVMTSYDLAGQDESRDTAFIFQVTYRPERFVAMN